MVLEALGESFPKEFNNDFIAKELASTNMKLQGVGPLESLPVMEDPQKKEAMVRVTLCTSLWLTIT